MPKINKYTANKENHGPLTNVMLPSLRQDRAVLAPKQNQVLSKTPQSVSKGMCLEIKIFSCKYYKLILVFICTIFLLILLIFLVCLKKRKINSTINTYYTS